MSLVPISEGFYNEGSQLKENQSYIVKSPGNDEWYIPKYIIDAARTTMGSIDLDPASSILANQTVMAKKIYTKEDNGLTQNWFGNIWLNPPYSRKLISSFSTAVVRKRQEYNQAIVLVNNATETNWFQNLFSSCSICCILNRRLKFIGINGKQGGSSLQGQIILYFGNNVEKFKENFSSYGTPTMPIVKPSLPIAA